MLTKTFQYEKLQPMKRDKTKNQIAKSAGLSLPGLSNIVSGRRRPSWSLAKRLGEVTSTDPVLWLEGTPEEIKEAISQETVAA